MKNSAWFGGAEPYYLHNNSCGDGQCPAANNLSQTDLLHQQAPYWLNGFVPLAVLLHNAGIDPPTPRSPGMPPIRPLQQAEDRVEYIIAHAGKSPCGAKSGVCVPAPVGWLGPYDLGLAVSYFCVGSEVGKYWIFLKKSG